MSTNRKLLELAAKAAGRTITGWCAGRRGADWAELSDTSKWNPIEDDGDALRLAVKLRIGIEINERSIVASWVNGGYEPNDVYEYPDSIQNDDFDVVYVNHDKATRRAIVRAAAEIGRNMQEGGAA